MLILGVILSFVTNLWFSEIVLCERTLYICKMLRANDNSIMNI